MPKLMKYFLFFVFALLFNAAIGVGAENKLSKEADSLSENTAVENVVDVEFSYEEAKEKVEAINQNLQENISKEEIDAYVAELSKIETALAKRRDNIEREAKYLQKQLEALTSNPEEVEDEAITKQREEISQNLAAQNKIIKESDLLIIQIEDLTVKILNLRNQKIYGDLLTKQSAFINPVVFFNGVKAYMIFFWDVVKSPVDWYENLPVSQRSYALFSIVAMFFILMVALIMAIMLRRFILRNWGYKADITKPTFNRKLVAAVAVAIARGLIFMFLIIGCIIWMESTKIFEGSFLDTVLMTTAFWTLLVIVESTVSRVTFAPKFPQWRLLNISTEKAARFTKMIFFYILCNATALIQVYIAKYAEYPPETQHFLIIISCAVTAFFLMWFAKIAFDSSKPEQTEQPEPAEQVEEDGSDGKLKMLMFSYVFCTLTFVASLFGYPELSLFILRRIVLSLILCGLFEVFRRSLIDIMYKIILHLPIMKKYKNSKKTSNKINFWLKAIINPILGLVFIFSFLNLWELPGDFMLLAIKKLLFGFKIGGIQISLIAIILGIVVFFCSLTVMRIIKNKLANNLLASVDMDDGIKHSLISGVSFVGFIISILLAIVSMGIDLTSLAFIAGALSVGIGFGLQDVIKNLVAGIIILLERPFRVGDWVIMNGEEGKSKQINIRSTEMETFKRSSVIIPNATLLSSSVTNLTHGDNMSRQSIKVGVSYSSDPEKVKQILLDCVKENKDVLKIPAPYVLFTDFGASSLDFEVRFYVRNLWESWSAPSDLRYKIFKKFAENGIEIPFNQLVVYNGDKANEMRELANEQEIVKSEK